MNRIYSLILRSAAAGAVIVTTALLLKGKLTMPEEDAGKLAAFICIVLIAVAYFVIYGGTSIRERKVIMWVNFGLCTLSVFFILTKKQLADTIVLMIALSFGFSWIAGMVKSFFQPGAKNVRPPEPAISAPAVSVPVASASASKGKTYTEKDNMGTRYDTEEKAMSWWLSRQTMSKKDPYLTYTFKSEEDAKAALLELPCIKLAGDTGRMICTETLVFGCFKADEAYYNVILSGADMSHDLWEKAREGFKRHGGTLVGEMEPQRITASGKDAKAKVPSPDPVVFVKEDRIKDQFGTTIYRIYKAPDARTAKEFLSRNPVTQRLFYIIVETPEGNYGRDIDGIYKEQV